MQMDPVFATEQAARAKRDEANAKAQLARAEHTEKANRYAKERTEKNFVAAQVAADRAADAEAEAEAVATQLTEAFHAAELLRARQVLEQSNEKFTHESHGFDRSLVGFDESVGALCEAKERLVASQIAANAALSALRVAEQEVRRLGGEVVPNPAQEISDTEMHALRAKQLKKRFGSTALQSGQRAIGSAWLSWE